MSKNNKIQSKIIGLDMGLSFGKFFLDSEDLHFGYWPNGETPTSKNFAWAQENHSNLIINEIPKDAKNILDVGSGSGNLALKINNLGYAVDCVIPSTYLAESVKNKLGEKSTIHICKFEDMELNCKYDTIIFSESFQYVNIHSSLALIEKLLSPGGTLIICDFFQLDVNEPSLMGGGHNWCAFLQAVENTSLINLINNDITVGTAPTIDYLNRFCQEVLKPISSMTGEYLLSNYPKITKFLLWRFKKRLQKINNRYLSGDVNGKSFKKFKTYRLLTYKIN